MPHLGIGEFDITMGNRLRNLRLEKGMSRQQLALKLGISHQQLSKFESGKNRLTASRMPQLCKIFKISPGFLLGNADCEDDLGGRSKLKLGLMRGFDKLDPTTQSILVNLIRHLASS